MEKVDPIRYLKDAPLEESDWLQSHFDADAHRFELVVDYAAEAVSDWFAARERGVTLAEYKPLPRDFRRLSFSGVTRLQTIPGTRKDARDLRTLRSARRSPWPTIECAVASRLPDGRYRMKLLTSDEGGLRFEFQALNMDKRLGRGKKRGRGWAYTDIDTNERFHIHDPFGIQARKHLRAAPTVRNGAARYVAKRTAVFRSEAMKNVDPRR